MATTTVAIYCRISKDRAGRAESVADQETRGRAYAARTWPGTPVEVWADNAVTAADDDAHRPGYDALRHAVRSGRVGHLWAVEQTRLQRTEVGWFELAAELVAAGITEVHTDRDGIVRVGDEVAGIKAVLAAAEVRKLTARVRDKHARLAAQGRPRGGREFGYRPGRCPDGEATLEVVETEAEHARWAADAILAGWSLTSVAEELNARGVALPRGGKAWETNAVRRMLTKATIAGLRVYRGEVVGRARWEPIIDEATWRQVCATLATRTAVRSPDGRVHPVVHTKRAARRYLLTGGIARCALCEAPLIGQQRRWKGSPLIPYYHCHPSKGGCSRIGIVGRQLEEHVRDRLLDEMDRRAVFRAALAEDTDADRRADLARALAAVDARQVELADRWAAGDLPAAAWDAARERLDVDRARLEADLAAVPPPAARVDAGELREGWEMLTVEERRHAVHLYVARVDIGPAVPGRRFDPDRAVIAWREV
jgi:DNA invertase Pin-like site-specific DNA recombinase